MKDLSFILIMLFIFIVWLTTITHQNNMHRKEIERFNYLDSIIKQRNHLDSTYWKHLEECSFINNNSLAFDSRGYVISNYHKRYKVEQ